MKPSRHKSVLGLVLTDRALLLAELVAGDTPEVRHLGEIPLASADLSAAAPLLAAYLKSNTITTRAVVVGLSARQVLVKPRDVPPTDRTTLNDLLRLQAETEFGADLKDLVYDYEGTPQTVTVLLAATPKPVLDAALKLCTDAGLKVLAVTSAAITLGELAARKVSPDALVLSTYTSTAQPTSELTARSSAAATTTDTVTTAVRTLRGALTDKAFLGELKRAAVAMSHGGRPRDLLLFNGVPLGPTAAQSQSDDALQLAQAIGLKVATPKLSELGVRVAPGISTEGRYAVPIALALAGLTATLSLDFLHTKLASPAERAIPRWLVGAVLSLIILGTLVYLAVADLQKQHDAVARLQRTMDEMQPRLKSADTFVSRIGFAQAWHAPSPRYLGCMRAIAAAFPEDSQTYAMNLSLRELPKPLSGSKKPVDTEVLTGTLTGKTTDQRRAQAVLEALNKSPVFSDVKSLGSGDVGRGQQVSFSISFLYRPETPPTPTTRAVINAANPTR